MATQRVARTRNAKTMTEAGFWLFLRETLRKRTMYWKPIAACRRASRRAYKGMNKRRKFEYQCNTCKQWFADKEVVVDHIVPAGSLKCYIDLPGYVERLFCEVEGLQVLCSGCHDKKSKKDVINIRKPKNVLKTKK